MVSTRGFRALALAAVMLLPSSALAQDSKSSALATELTKLLDEMKLDSVAAGSAGQFTAALYFPGSQLLVVTAKYSMPDRIDYLIGQKAYRDVYIDLNSAAEQQAKVFVSDLGANGLHPRRQHDQPFDTVDMEGKSVSFDGEWRKAKMSEDDYRQAFQTADEAYARMLQALIGALKKSS